MARKKQAEEGGGESWLMSYCDMITLLVTFFLMMMTFSTKNDGDIQEIGIGLLKGRGGVWPPMLGKSFKEQLDPALVQQAAEDLDQLIRDTDGAVALRKSVDGLTIQFAPECSFAPGSAEPPPALVRDLRAVASALERYTWSIVVEGATDSGFVPQPEHPTAVSMGLARAEAAAQILLENPRVARRRVQVGSFGMDRPLASNDTAIGRRANRSVSVRIVALSVSAASRADRRGEAETQKSR